MTQALQLAEEFSLSDLFAKPPQETIEGLFKEYGQKLSVMEQISSAISEEVEGALVYFVKGNMDPDRRYLSEEKIATSLFDFEGGKAALNAEFWEKTLNLTDVLDCMPQKRRTEWYEQIQQMKTPDFTPEIVAATIQHLLASRQKFFSERVDGVFNSLSPDHVTNCPQGFRKRMILNYVVNPKWDSTDYHRCGVINDLRVVIARFMGRDEPHYNSTSRIVEYAYRYNRGQWFLVDGGSLRMRVYGKGTVHIEVHPEMAWKLNAVLSFLHPNAIPSEHRRRPTRVPKNFELTRNPIPNNVLDALSDLVRRGTGRKFPIRYEWRDLDKHLKQRAVDIMISLGAIYSPGECFEFSYDASDVLNAVLASGVVPDEKAHQYYPTPSEIAIKAVEEAQISDTDRVLEPSAGQGNIAKYLPESATCVEVDPLHCAILRAKGFNPVEEDFLKYQASEAFDRIVMNPPYSQGRWERHLEKAAGMLKPGGILTAILPASARDKKVLPTNDYSLIWPWEEDIPFEGTSISVCLLKVVRK